MPANTSPVFGIVPNTGMARVAGATTDSSGATTANIQDLFTAGSNGSIVTRIRWANSQITAAASSAMVAKIWITDNAGANLRLFLEFTIPATTRSVSVVGAGSYFDIVGGLALIAGQKLKVGQSVYAGAQDVVDYTAEGWDY